MNFSGALNECINKNLVFAAYRLPHSDSVRLVIQKNNTIHKVSVTSVLFEESGFLVVPFHESEINYSFIIKPDLNYLSTDYIDFEDLIKLEPFPEDEPGFNNGKINKTEFLSNVEKIKAAINEKKFEKAVISRIKIIEKDYFDKISDIFMLLTTSYPNAFVYIFNAAGHFWMGATPEPLICSDKNQLTTVSLAGTRKYNPENLNLPNWSKKERIEQEIVTLFIEESLKNLNIELTQKNGPYTKKAGNLVHLRTDFTFKLKGVKDKLGELVQELHPTSAVCGLPKHESMEFLLKIEKHNRSYYSGIIGPINLDEKIQLFVNLRCMRIFKKKLILYIGAGITEESVAEDEWAETEIKSETLLSIIHKV